MYCGRQFLSPEALERLEEHEKKYQEFIKVCTKNHEHTFDVGLQRWFCGERTLTVVMKDENGCICTIVYPLVNVEFYSSGEYLKKEEG